VILANPLFNLFSDLNREPTGEIGFPLRHKPVIIVRARIALAAQSIQLRNQLSFWINREFECIDRSVVFIAASANDSISTCAQCRCRRSSNRVLSEAQLRISLKTAVDAILGPSSALL
jgi:hypothetical protein